jgi:7,8-dihydroneopterin aldolase/epimerase/oxygenase
MKILIENLTFESIIGILEYERTTPQQIIVDCTIDYPYTNNHFINYAEVSETIIQTMNKEQFELIETALEVLSSTLKKQFPLIKELSLTIKKPTILPHCSVGVQHTTQF